MSPSYYKGEPTYALAEAMYEWYCQRENGSVPRPFGRLYKTTKEDWFGFADDVLARMDKSGHGVFHKGDVDGG